MLWQRCIWKKGEVGKAMSLYEESLAIKEQVGDLRGKIMTVVMIAQLRSLHKIGEAQLPVQFLHWSLSASIEMELKETPQIIEILKQVWLEYIHQSLGEEALNEAVALLQKEDAVLQINRWATGKGVLPLIG
ncbi:MAG: hypothetical protein R2795_23675 [Saprospiraceae bacterium]